MTNVGELRVIAASLRQAAGIWDEQATAIGSVSATAGAMRLDRVEAGVFQLIVGPYDAVADQVSARCEEGMQDMRGIASALDRSADTYQLAEQASIGDIHVVQSVLGARL
jgi:Excreted virulence factor EspC, type VII ESX diderm